MQRATAKELTEDFKRLAERARLAPIAIATGSGSELVILSMAEYDRLQQLDRRVWQTAKAPEDVVEAVRNARMDKRHAHLDELLKDGSN